MNRMPINQSRTPDALIGAEGIVTSMERSCWRSNPEERYHSVAFDIRFPYFTVQITDPPMTEELIAYCLEYTKSAPDTGSLLEGIDPYEALAPLPQAQVNQILWLLENGYPATRSETLFAAAGVDAAASPPLLDFDAFAATQLAIWVIESGLPYYSVEDCENALPHPKSPRIGATAQYLVGRAQAVGSTAAQTPYVNIVPQSISTVVSGGVYYVGPYAIETNMEGTISLSSPQTPGAYVVNSNFVSQDVFYPGNLFYVAIPQSVIAQSACVTMEATLIGADASAVVMFPKTQSGSPRPTFQDLGMTLYTRDQLLATDQVTACADVPAMADLAIDKVVDHQTAAPGDVLTYTLHIQNLGPDTAQAAMLTDTVVLENLSDIEYSLDGGSTWQSWQGQLMLGDLVPGTSITMLCRGTVTLAPGSMVVNTAVVSSQTPDPNPNNNTSTVTVPVEEGEQLADLSITKTVDHASAVPGDVLTYTIEIQNLGPDVAVAAEFTDIVVLDNLTALEYSVDGGITWQTWLGRLPLGDLALGEMVGILGRGTVVSSPGSVVVNAAVVSSETPDPNPDNNSATVNVPIVGGPAAADLGITKVVDQPSAVPGDVLTYTLEITNHGPDTAEAAMLTDTVVLDNLTALEYSLDGGVTWNGWQGQLALGNMAPGDTITMLGRGTVMLLPGSVVVNTAVVSSQTPDPNPDNNSATVNVPVVPVLTFADLAITKTVQPQMAVPGDVLTYTLRIENLGPDTAVDAMLTDRVVLDNLTALEYSLDGGQTWQSWTGELALGDLSPGSGVTMLGRGTVVQAPGSVVVNAAVVSSDTPDPNPDNNTATTTVPVVPGQSYADVSIAKVANKVSTVPCGELMYTLRIENHGPNAAQQVVVSDRAALSILSNPEYSLDGGITWQHFSGTISLGNVSAGDIRTVLLRGRVTERHVCKIKNTAYVTSETEDPVMENNSATVYTLVNPCNRCACNVRCRCAAPCKPKRC